MIEMTPIEWDIEDAFGRPHELWYPYSKGFDYSSFGVYILWQYQNSRPTAIYAGKGRIKNRFSCHRGNERITKHYSLKNPIYVTWAKVEEDSVYGIENYLHRLLTPCESRAKPGNEPIPVNLPDCFN